MRKVAVGIVGASGYTGLELVKILLQHPYFELTYIAGSEDIQSITEIHSSLKNVFEQSIHKACIDGAKECCSLLFLALPHKKAMEFAKKALEAEMKVVDLSADYRLNEQTYKQYYTEHIDKEHLKEAVYGLIEWQRGLIQKARLVANPGCYPTASLLGLLPFTPYIDIGYPIFIDAKSGVSGAGKTLSYNTHFVNINENMFAYAPFSHRHEPEIYEKLCLLGDCKAQIRFVPHLVPLSRGMLISAFVRLKAHNIDTLSLLKDCYKGERWIRICDSPVSVKNVAGTHFCDIYIQHKDRDLWINVAIDNLLRGASSQAVFNANLMCGFDEETAIPFVAYVP